jgi:predicted RNA-binding Zn-ribbon protein involved in translation (DUF1610 family)
MKGDLLPIEMVVWEESVPSTDLGNRQCPFCGSFKLSHYTSRRDEEIKWSGCDDCGATGPNTKDPSIGWNCRVDERGSSGPKTVMMTFAINIDPGAFEKLDALCKEFETHYLFPAKANKSGGKPTKIAELMMEIIAGIRNLKGKIVRP